MFLHKYILHISYLLLDILYVFYVNLIYIDICIWISSVHQKYLSRLFFISPSFAVIQQYKVKTGLSIRITKKKNSS